MVILQPHENLTLYPIGEYKAYRELPGSNGTILLSSWYTLGGEVVIESDEYITYHAPAEPGLYTVIWDNGIEYVAFFVEVVGEETSELLKCAQQVVVPSIGSERFLLVASPPRGVDVCLKEGVPLLPGSRPRGSCSEGNSKAVSNTTIREGDGWREAAQIHITAELAAKLASIGISVSVGMTINVMVHERVHTTINKTDCYRCENGAWKLVGGRVSYVRCVYVMDYSPTWVCRAVEAGIILLDPCGGRPRPDYHCVYWGDCKCPESVIIGCP